MADALCVVSELENMIIKDGKSGVQNDLMHESETGLAMKRS